MALMLGVVLAIVLALNMRDFFELPDRDCRNGVYLSDAAPAPYSDRRRHRHLFHIHPDAYHSVSEDAERGRHESPVRELAKDTVIKAATDPSFFRAISQAAEYAAFSNIKSEVEYDYYGDRSTF